MCGIAGGAWIEQPKQLNEMVHKAIHSMRFRGPNDQGVEFINTKKSLVALAHTRLSIIDLSDAGHQPMNSSNGRWSIVFNGEIYKYRELRLELQSFGFNFTTNSDTEVLLSAWQHWGFDCLPKLVGMFAFAVFDKYSSTLTCVRDSFGINPLFYTEEHDHFAFASEIPALLELLRVKPELNWQRAYDYLVHGDYDSSPDTFYAGLKHLLPGHWIQANVLTGQIGSPQRWWHPKITERAAWRFDDAVQQVREQFLENVRLHLRSDVPFGAALSGGIDSSAVVCAMRYLEPNLPIHTFSFISEDKNFSEEPWVDRVNKHVDAISHKVKITPQDLVSDLDDLIKAQGEPFGSSSIYAQYRVFQLAKERGVSVILEGQGADEMLAGYIGYPGHRLRSLIETRNFRDAWHFYRNWSKWPGRNYYDALQYTLSEFTQGKIHSFLRNISGRPSEPSWISPDVLKAHGVKLLKPRTRSNNNMVGRRVIDELALSLSSRGLCQLLRHGDRSSMRFSIENRVPFLTLDMVNLLLSMPEEYLISSQGETKHVFRAAMSGIGSKR